MAAPNRYQYDIPSVQAVNPTLPARLGLADLNCTIAKGDVISRKNLVHAKGVALILSGLRSCGQHPIITAEIVESAELRVRALEAAHCMAQYCPVDLKGILVDINQKMEKMAERLSNMEQRMNNTEQGVKDMQQGMKNMQEQMNDIAKDAAPSTAI